MSESQGSTKLAPAAGNPCQECPFRKSNANREHPQNLYRNEQFTSEWKQVAAGSFFACHVTAPDLHPYDERSRAAGYVPPVETGQRPECSGAVLAIQRELDLALIYPSYRAYKAARPTGLSQQAFRNAVDRIKGVAAPEFRVPAKFNVDFIRNPAEEIDTKSPPWVFGGQGTDAMMAIVDELLGCSCPVCANHSDVHDMRAILTAEGQTISVDARLVPLLEAMNRRGLRTTDSCENLSEAIQVLWPERLPEISKDVAGTVNYASTVISGSAFIRLRATSRPERQFIQAARHIGEWQSGAGIAQVSFSLADTRSLLNAVQTISAAPLPRG